MTTAEAAITVVASMGGWRFYSDTWECTKLVMLPDHSVLPLVVTVEIAPYQPADGQTKEDAEGELMLNFLTALPVLLKVEEDSEVAAAIERGDDEDTNVDQQGPQ